MADVSVLNVLLHGQHIGTLINVGHDRSLFSLTESYIENANRATLGLRFKDSFGELITEFKPTQTALMPYFSNLLPEGHLRDYLSARAGVKSEREFFLLWALGMDLPGALTVTVDKDEVWPSDLVDRAEESEGDKDKRLDDELKHLSARALLPEKMVLDTARETVAFFHEHWQMEKTNLPLYSNVLEAIDKHIDKVPIFDYGFG